MNKFTLKEKKNYPWVLNDSIRYFNKLDETEKSSVIEGLKEIKTKFLNVLSHKDSQLEVTFFREQLTLATAARKQYASEGPSASWVYAALTEALCILFVRKKYEDALSFLEEI